MSTIEVSVGAIIALEEGEYSDKQFGPLLRAIKPITSEVWEQARSCQEQRRYARYDGSMIVERDASIVANWLVVNGYAEEIDFIQLHVDDKLND
jgi:hypothetical protein